MRAQAPRTNARRSDSRLRRASLATTSPAQFAILVFTGFILVLTAVLSLPIATTARSATPLADALFTAVSSICVTGLSTVDMATHWSTFGNVAILIGLEVGGIGVLTMASLLGLVVSRRLRLRTKLMAASDTNPLRLHQGPVAEGQAVRLGEMGGLLATVAISVFAIELAITALITPRLLLGRLRSVDGDLAGLLLRHVGLHQHRIRAGRRGPRPRSPAIPGCSAAISLAVFLGSLGFPVIFALARRVRERHRLSMHVKLTLITTGILIVVGRARALRPRVEQSGHPGRPGSRGAADDRLVPVDHDPLRRFQHGRHLRDARLEPHGDGHAHVRRRRFGLDRRRHQGDDSRRAVPRGVRRGRGDANMQVFGRRIPSDVLRLSVSVVLWGATVVAVSTIAVLQTTDQPLDSCSSTSSPRSAPAGSRPGSPPSCRMPAKYILAATMWAGRVGTVTLAAALAASQRRQLFRYPEERPIVG